MRVAFLLIAALAVAACNEEGASECASCSADGDCSGMVCRLFTGGGTTALLCGHSGTVCECTRGASPDACRVAESGCTASQSCTPASALVPCKTYATRCDASGVRTCEVAGNEPEGTSCEDGGRCTTGECRYCNLLTLTAPPARAMRLAQSAAAPQGGFIVDGTYHSSGWNIYTGPGGAAGPLDAEESRVRTFASGTMETVVRYSGNVQNAGVVGRSTATYEAAGTQLTLAFTCAPPGTPPVVMLGYTVAGSDLKIYTAYTTSVDGVPTGSTVHESILTRR